MNETVDDTELNASDWRMIANLRRGLNEFSEVEFGSRLNYVADGLCSLVEGSHLLVVVARTIRPEGDLVDGIRPVFSREFGPRTLWRREVRYRWMTQEPELYQDPLLEFIACGAGEPRAVRQRSALDAEVWAGSPVRRLLDQLEVDDRLSAIIPLNAFVEVHFIVDRSTNGPLFNKHEARLLLAAVKGLQPLGARLAWRNGLMRGQRRLEVEELAGLDALLGAADFAELAAASDFSRADFEQMTASIYEKLAVRDRAELLRTWLEGVPLSQGEAELDSVAPQWILLRVRQAIDDTLAAGDLTLDCVAQSLGTTADVVRQALDSTDTTFRELADSARHERAKLLLSRPWLNIAEVALQLGYNQVSSLNRAVKRWTGDTPVGMRASLLETR